MNQGGGVRRTPRPEPDRIQLPVHLAVQGQAG